ncbi:unnamed protein product [Clonostachys byssicola]|uniref:Uncharacterized protein n=1 Tax=Clonostachys byssicola TaxID=160290 RepID=A0A9N9UZ26_9HYPO|nr:unnamed protein product [Clonostachys byssicola]
MSDIKITPSIMTRNQHTDMRSMLVDLDAELTVLMSIVEDKDKRSGSVAACTNCLTLIDDITEVNAKKALKDIREKLNVIIPDLEYMRRVAPRLGGRRKRCQESRLSALVDEVLGSTSA